MTTEGEINEKRGVLPHGPPEGLSAVFRSIRYRWHQEQNVEEGNIVESLYANLLEPPWVPFSILNIPTNSLYNSPLEEAEGLFSGVVQLGRWIWEYQAYVLPYMSSLTIQDKIIAPSTYPHIPWFIFLHGTHHSPYHPYLSLVF